MKRFISWFTKFSKIVAIVEYIYRGILITKDVVVLVKKEIIDIKPDFHYTEALDKTIDYLTKAAEAVALVLKWIGADPVEIEKSVNVKLLSDGKKDAVEDLGKVTEELDKFVQNNKK